jgi:hypothetical protein
VLFVLQRFAQECFLQDEKEKAVPIEDKTTFRFRRIIHKRKNPTLKMLQFALLNRVPFGKFNRASAFPSYSLGPVE